MIQYEKLTLKNGLRVLLHHDPNTPIAAINTAYDVGARDEDPQKTGFAHLFEHLMFGGSEHIPDFDQPLENAGGSSNAFTSNDITNYFNTLPIENIETALWLESDRMKRLAFTPKSLEVQRNVVIEEFKQNYLNQPYGNVWMELRPMAYEKHPYQWSTIGKEISHIENVALKEVKDFFFKHYGPQNAVLTIAGNIDFNHTKKMVEKWYGDIPQRDTPVRNLPAEPEQKELRKKTIKSEVPANAFYWAFKMPARLDKNYFKADLVSDLLARGKSARLYQVLVKEKALLSEVSAFITGSFDAGLLMITGKLNEKVSFEDLEYELNQVLEAFIRDGITQDELQKVLNQFETTKNFSENGVLNKAMNLSIFEVLDSAELMNEELDQYRSIKVQQLNAYLPKILDQNKLSILNIATQS